MKPVRRPFDSSLSLRARPGRARIMAEYTARNHSHTRTLHILEHSPRPPSIRPRRGAQPHRPSRRPPHPLAGRPRRVRHVAGRPDGGIARSSSRRGRWLGARRPRPPAPPASRSSSPLRSSPAGPSAVSGADVVARGPRRRRAGGRRRRGARSAPAWRRTRRRRRRRRPRPRRATGRERRRAPARRLGGHEALGLLAGGEGVLVAPARRPRASATEYEGASAEPSTAAPPPGA